MKVALVHMRHKESGGTERYLNQVAAYLAGRGDDVTIVCRSHEDPPHPAVRFALLRPLAIGAAWRMWSFAAAVERHVRTTAYDVVYGLGKTWMHDVIRLGGGCHQTYLDLAHRSTLSSPSSTGSGPRGGSSLRLLLDHASPKHRLALAIEQRALRPAAYRQVVTNSEMVKRDVMHRHAVPAERVSVVYNGVDLERFHPRRRAVEGTELRRACGWTAGDLVVLFLGTGYGRKGLDVLLDAFARLDAPRSRLLVVGFDSDSARFERRAERLGIAGRARFLGGRRDVESCFASADLYVLPTRYDPFANTTLEALASGLPAITSATNGAAELIEEGVQGSVLPNAEDSDALLDRLRFWNDRRRLAAASAAARALAERHPESRTAEASARILDAAAGRAP
jgi:UDP-glucose:(heptosyl)LPS alpha-1,3-glucosyltransferase